MNGFLAFIIIEVMCLVGVIADYYLKLAGDGERYIEPKPFIIGVLLYSLTAIGWVVILKHITFVQIGVFYSVSMICMLTFLGWYYFNEQVGLREIAGLCCAFLSIFLLARFA